MAGFKLLVPLDRSSRDRVLLPFMYRHAELHGTTFYLLHVVTKLKSLVPNAARSAETYVDAFERQLRAKGLEAYGHVRKGDPVEEILKFAGEYEVDSIVMSTRGPRGVDKMIMGSVTKSVFANCPYPITLINESAAQTALDKHVWAQSSYMAHAIWNKVARGIWTNEDALAELTRLAALGLDHDVLTSTFASLQQSGVPAEWMDFDFQEETLKEFAPPKSEDDTNAA